MKAHLKRVRISSQKANLVAALIRRKKALEALDILKFTPKKGAKIIAKVIKSALANAENNFKQNPQELYLKEILVTQGPTYKRHRPISRGRSHPILKRTSHITISLELKNDSSKTSKPTKETKTTVKTTTLPKSSPPNSETTPTPQKSSESKSKKTALNS